MNKLWNRVMNFGTGSEFLLFFCCFSDM